VSEELPPPSRPPKEVPDLFPGLTERILALTPEDMLDTSIEDRRTEENFRLAAQLHADALARGYKSAIALDRLSKQGLRVPEIGPEQ